MEGRGKMDLRIIKTRTQIKEAFLSLRDKFMPEKIRVKDICDRAMINKTTFYKYYEDSSDLCNEIEEDAIEIVLDSFTCKNMLLDDPKKYFSDLISVLERQSGHLKVVFRGKYEIFSSKLSEKLIKLYDNSSDCLEDKIKLSYAIGGFVRIANDSFLANKKYDLEKLSQYSESMIRSIPR